MNCGDLTVLLTPKVSQHRGSLAALAASGQAHQYLGKAWMVDHIDLLDDEEVEKRYARYEAQLSAAITKTLRQAALQLYAGLAGLLILIPMAAQPKLVAALKPSPSSDAS